MTPLHPGNEESVMAVQAHEYQEAQLWRLPYGLLRLDARQLPVRWSHVKCLPFQRTVHENPSERSGTAYCENKAVPCQMQARNDLSS